MKQRISCMILLAGLVTMLAGCSESFNGKNAGQVSFTVSAKSGPDTKTAYSGDLVTENNKLYERINWVPGDQIRIYSSNKSQVGVGVVNNVSDPVDHYDYTIGTVTANDRRSDATINKPAEGQGLTWINDPYGVLFYGTYPPLAATYNDDKLKSFTGMTIPQDQATTVEMSHAYMLAAPAQYVASDKVDDHGVRIPHMHMDFYPVFNAFYIVLGSQRGEIQIDAIELVTTTSDGYLSGSYSYDFTIENAQLTNGPVVNGVVYRGDDNKNSVKVALPSGTKIKPGENGAAGDSVRVTLLTLPPQTGTGLTNMVLNVYHDGKTEPAKLKLNYSSGTAINFPAFHKARITGLAMEGGKWQLNIMTDVNDWTLVTKETSFANQVGFRSYQDEGGRNVLISGMTETGNHEMPNDVPATDPSYYARYYQIRTLDMSVDNPHFVVKFMPATPIGGYWMLAPEGIGEGSLQHFDIKHHLGEGVYSDELMGQIMGTEVEIHIFPSEDFDPNAGVSYAMIMKCFFSAQRSFDDPYNADSEFQDVHGDGRYSYWRFTLPSNN